jgi:hypothetical protein
MITCKVTCVIQGLLPLHYLRNVNLSNYELSHVHKSVTLQLAFTLVRFYLAHFKPEWRSVNG